MKKYTVGFIFNKDLSKVLLIHKTKPEWQAGRINGIGGKVEDGEEYVDCMVREAEEETGIKSKSKDWVSTGVIEGKDAVIATFGYQYEGELFDAFVYEKEKIEWFSVQEIPDNVIMNLNWLIPLTIEKIRDAKILDFKVTYSDF